ncbi:MAG: hypothetical protein QNK31_00780 [Porticoccus sp.]|nr:hypothetical protein [Porticoccus sp.]
MVDLQSVATTMAFFAPLDGLPMATRSTRVYCFISYQRRRCAWMTWQLFLITSVCVVGFIELVLMSEL